MALYFYFNETTGDLVYSDQASYGASGYTSLGQQTNMNPDAPSVWVFDSKRESIKTVTKDPAVGGKIAGLTRMIGMFYGCSSLASVDLSGFDTSQVTNMRSMFNGCSSLTTLDLSGFDTSQVTNMSNMFSGCSSLTTLDLSSFDTTKAMTPANMFRGCSLDTVRCRPRQFLEHVVPMADETSAAFLIPSSSGKWYDFKGAEVTDFTSDVPTTLYSDPSKAPDGSKLVNLQDLKAALETMDSGLPFTEDTVIAEKEGEPVWGYMADAGNGSPGFAGRIEQEGYWAQTLLTCVGLQLRGSLPVGGSGNKQIAIAIGFTAGSPAISFRDDKLSAGLTYRDGMPVLTAMGESSPVMAGDHPYGFATYATDEDFESYVFQEG